MKKALGRCPCAEVLVGSGISINYLLDTGSQVSTVTESFYNEHLAQKNDLVDVGQFISMSAYIRVAKFYRVADTDISHVDVFKIIIIIIKICFTLVCCHLLNASVFAYLGFSYFMHIEHKVYVLYDHPHLVKNVRNNLKKHGFNVDGNMVQWKYIADFYHADSRLPIRMAPKLTSKHIELPPFVPLSVKLATQVLSDYVAAGITTMVNLGALSEDAQHTAVFVGLMDRMFTAVFVERMDRMFTAVFVEWMDRMFNVFKMLNTRLSLLGGWTECSLLPVWSGWTECSMCSRCSTHGCLCWADGQNVQCVQQSDVAQLGSDGPWLERQLSTCTIPG